MLIDTLSLLALPHAWPPAALMQHNPSPGLEDQLGVSSSGLRCLACIEGSIALAGSLTAENATDATMPTGATFCDAW